MIRITVNHEETLVKTLNTKYRIGPLSGKQTG